MFLALWQRLYFYNHLAELADVAIPPDCDLLENYIDCVSCKQTKECTNRNRNHIILFTHNS